MPLTLAILSDLHLEQASRSIMDIFPTETLSQSDALCLLGDIGTPLLPNFFKFLHECATHAKHVIFVPGNHEYYNTNVLTIPELDRVMKATCDQYENVTYLKNRTITLPGKDEYSLIGTTLWSHIPSQHAEQVTSCINDYNYIFSDTLKRLTVDDVNSMHKENIRFISDEVAAATSRNQKSVVLTHHVPLTLGTSHPRHQGSAANAAFATDLCDYLYTHNINFWACGHTHYNFDITLANNTRVVSNQRGCYDKPIRNFRTSPFTIP